MKFVESGGRVVNGDGTGFMIAEDVMVTAAHCVYPKPKPGESPIGPARSVDALFGYINGDWTERRHGKVVATSQKWIEGSESDRARDIAVVLLSRRSTHDKNGSVLKLLMPFQPAADGSQGASWLFIAGHPTDIGDGNDMQEGSGYVQWDIRRDNMRLAYAISTHGGKCPCHSKDASIYKELEMSNPAHRLVWSACIA